MYGSAPAPEDDDKPFAEGAAPYVAEFVGTYLLVFAIAVNSILAEPWGPTAVGALLVVLVYIFGPISGAYLNPAVSVAAGLAGQIPWRTVMAYTVLQITAGFIAGLACYGVFQMRMGGSPCCTLSVLGGSISGTAIHYNASVCDSQRDCF